MKFYGNNEVITDLKFALYKPSASYILLGDQGLGKATIGKYFAKKILCGSRSQCNCDSCRKFDNNSHPDFIHVMVEEGAKAIKVDQVREIISSSYRAPVLSKRKVYFIDDANLMTTEAQNGLLKTLEEGFEYVTFIFIAHKPLLATIDSRSITYKFNPLPKEIIKQGLDLEGIHLDLVTAGVKGIGRGKELSKDTTFLIEAGDLINTLLDIPNLSKDAFLNELGLLKEKGTESIVESNYLDELLYITYYFFFDLFKYRFKDNKLMFKSISNSKREAFTQSNIKTIDTIVAMVEQLLKDKDRNLINKDDLFLLFANIITKLKED